MTEKSPHIGELAPDFETLTDTGERVKLSDYRGKRVVLYFYPKDDTPGCTTQSCGFRDAYPRIQEKNAIVLGISPDGVESHQHFKQKFNLPFTLLTDVGHAICDLYGVWGERNMMGHHYMGVIRSHFVIDETGKIVAAEIGVKAKESVEQALSTLG